MYAPAGSATVMNAVTGPDDGAGAALKRYDHTRGTRYDAGNRDQRHQHEPQLPARHGSSDRHAGLPK